MLDYYSKLCFLTSGVLKLGGPKEGRVVSKCFLRSTRVLLFPYVDWVVVWNIQGVTEFCKYFGRVSIQKVWKTPTYVCILTIQITICHKTFDLSLNLKFWGQRKNLFMKKRKQSTMPTNCRSFQIVKCKPRLRPNTL